MKCSVFIATSSDGYIADEKGGIEWLQSVPNPENIDMGYADFISSVDALIMGRKTFETVCGFDIPWPYDIPVFVLSRSLNSIPQEYHGKVKLVEGELKTIVNQLENKGFEHLYIDGGSTIKSFLNEDLIDEMTLTTIPIVLGGGTCLFSTPDKNMGFELVGTKVFLGRVNQKHYLKLR